MKFWNQWAKPQALIIGFQLGVDPSEIFSKSHGRRTIDTLAFNDKSKADWDYISSIEGSMTVKFGFDAAGLPGSRNLLTALNLHGAK
ncbi:hypothetical protein NUU61_003036 [Penicillium alfredii]|uniref:Uncharacterized protein n=1 Tax=Penicillium alfredii TaxID=1506179 RepID=A0A9W9KGH8_9EURO|nr:uncharacterized protein NUU61_003036 [Penicillium alfredii]KAJ5105689.1 hypothetical protein NUU61_003036 [Penicillium alfredii]